jgi:putative membrane protein
MSCLLALAVALTWSGFAHADKMSKSDTSPQDVLSQIHTTNQNEISMAKLALQKAQSPEVKKFAQKMIQDHTQADQKVMQLAKKEGVTAEKYPLSAQEQGQVDQLEAASSTEFDRLYMEANRKGHDKAISMLENAEKQTSDPKVKKLVAELLPKVQHHDRMAKEIRPSENNPTS